MRSDNHSRLSRHACRGLRRLGSQATGKSTCAWRRSIRSRSRPRKSAEPGSRSTNLTPAGPSRTTSRSRPARSASFTEVDLALLLGHGFQPQLEKAAGGTGSSADACSTRPGLERYRERRSASSGWIRVRFALFVKRIAIALHRDPVRLQRLVGALKALDREYRRGLALCARREVVTSHEAFAYLAQRYGLHQVAITGLTPEAEPLREISSVSSRSSARPMQRRSSSRRSSRPGSRRRSPPKQAPGLLSLNPIEGLTPRRGGGRWRTTSR